MNYILLLINILIYLLYIINKIVSFPCPNYCSNEGQCLSQGICLCNERWTGPDCSIAKCPMGIAWSGTFVGSDNGHTLMECSNRGKCDVFGICQCDIGFTGKACEKTTCSCSGHGQCMSMSVYALSKDPGDGEIFKYEDNWDSQKIFGCKCDKGYTGYKCSDRECDRGDDPFVGFPSDPKGTQYNEKQLITCKATGGSFTVRFRGFTTDPINTDDTKDIMISKLKSLDSITDIDVKFAGITTTACTSIGNEITIEFIQDFGNLPLIIVDRTNLIHDTSTVLLTVITIIDGTKENLYCSGRGTCDRETGLCSCYTNYFSSNGKGGIGQRPDCGYATTTITQCPGLIACSGNGICQGPPNYNCICNNGWQGGDCSEKLCPLGKSWFDLPIDNNIAHQLVECSNNGSCDRTKGICVCKEGFTGEACNRMACPNDCSGHGICKTIRRLAKDYKINGEFALFTYGEVPNKKETWDADMIQGCLCDNDWEGYDCSKRKCATGDDYITKYDPITNELQVPEVQILCCIATKGNFILKFREETTNIIPFTASSDFIKNELENLNTINSVNVQFSSGLTACTIDGINKITITFIDNFGNLPSLKVIYDTVNSITSFTISTDGLNGSVMGTKEDAVCSNRGLCDHTTGKCKCFEGFISSDGKGNQGQRGDCSYFEQIYLNSQAKLKNES